MKTKSEKLVTEIKPMRNDKDELVKQNKAVNVALKSSQKDLKDSTHRYNKKIEELEAKIEDLTKFKILKNSEEKELRNMKKKAEKKLKEVREKEAKLKLDQNYFERNHKHLNDDINSELGDDNHNLKGDSSKEDFKNAVDQVSVPDPDPTKPTPTCVLSNPHLEPHEDPHCIHGPQCVLRDPHPPPHGPPTHRQYELQQLVMKNEAERQKMETLKDKILALVKPEPGDTYDDAQEKLECLKFIFDDDDEASEFDKLFEMLNFYKEAKNDTTEHDPDYYDDLSEMAPHYWGGDDGNELIFYDE
jgi:hypothetical protein